jgi:uncharacterized protein
MTEFTSTDANDRPLKYTLCVTQRCNLNCAYCYVRKTTATMDIATASRILDFIFQHAPASRTIEIGFFGGEPLLEFDLIKNIASLISNHPAYSQDRVSLTLTSNGTVFSDTIARFLREYKVKFCVSCDGPPPVQNLFRRDTEGHGSAARVERTLRSAVLDLPAVLVNAVYHPQTFRYLPETVEYLSGLGLRQIYLNPDFSAAWTRSEADELAAVYRAIGQGYVRWYLDEDPHFISLIDSKIAVLLRGGYHPLERCQMGKGEMAFTPDGGIYPCERLIGDGIDPRHRIGHIDEGIDLSRLSCRLGPREELNPECLSCGLKNCCMNWCACSNAFMTGYYNRVGPLLCASEKAAITTACDVFAVLEKKLGPQFLHHLSGTPQLNSRLRSQDLHSESESAAQGRCSSAAGTSTQPNTKKG